MEQDIKETIINSYSEIAVRHRPSCGCCETGEGGAAEHPAKASSFEPDLGCGAPLDHAALAPGLTVLDLGSGSGREVFNAARAVGPSGRAIGLDMTPAMIDLARKNAAVLGITNVDFRLGDIERMPLPDGSVDRVISNCVINLTRDKRKAFSEVYRVLAPGGRFAISDITSSAPLPAAIRENPELWCGCVGGALPTGEYLDAIRESGFTEVTVVSTRPDTSCGREGLGLQSITVTGRK
jgi:arsenite methyltransferase